MTVKQIFSSYEHQGNLGLDNIKYCCCCGHAFDKRMESGRMRPVCPECGFVYYKNPGPGVSVLIVQEEQVLLCKRAPGNFQSGKWCLPCGYIEFDEDYLTAGRREVKEETGLDIEIHSIINVTFNYLSPEIHSLIIVLKAGITGGTPVAGDDIETVAWFPIAGPLPDMAFASDLMIIRQYQGKKLAEIAIG